MDLEKHYGTIAQAYNWLDNRDLVVGFDLIDAVRKLVWELFNNKEELLRLTSEYKLIAQDKLHTDAIYCGLFHYGANDIYDLKIFDGESFYSLIEAMQGKISAPIRIGSLDFGHCQFCDFARLIMAAEKQTGQKPAYDPCQKPIRLIVPGIGLLTVTGNPATTLNATSTAGTAGWRQDSATATSTIPPAFAYRQLAYSTNSTNWGTR